MNDPTIHVCPFDLSDVRDMCISDSMCERILNQCNLLMEHGNVNALRQGILALDGDPFMGVVQGMFERRVHELDFTE